MFIKQGHDPNDGPGSVYGYNLFSEEPTAGDLFIIATSPQGKPVSIAIRMPQKH